MASRIDLHVVGSHTIDAEKTSSFFENVKAEIASRANALAPQLATAA